MACRALVIDRFDLRPNGTYREIEDFCVLNARSTAEKYRGSYETPVLKRFRQVASGAVMAADVENLFTLMAQNCALRNGDALRKNFDVVYTDLEGTVALAPVYDLVATTACIPADAMASPSDDRRAGLTPLASGRPEGIGSPATVRAILERVSNALAETLPELATYAKERPAFAEIAGRMRTAWEAGLTETLGGSPGTR